MAYKTKIPLEELFSNKSDVCQYLKADLTDEQYMMISRELGIDELDIDYILGRAKVFVDVSGDATIVTKSKPEVTKIEEEMES